MPKFEVDATFHVEAATADDAFGKVDRFLNHLYSEHNGLSYELLDGAAKVVKPDDAVECFRCGREFSIDGAGIAYHIDESAPDGIDHDADADHVAFLLERDDPRTH